MTHFPGFPHVLEAQQFSREWLEQELFPLAREMRKVVQERNVSSSLEGKGMITLFYEPSTRTRLSFEIAMQRLGGRVVSTENAREFSSSVKGETLEDTLRVVQGYHPDVIVLRHFEEGAARRAADISKAAIINTGDGTGQHPTQALLDIFTIREEIGRVDGVSVAIVGDIEKARQIKSLVVLLSNFSEIKLYFVCPKTSRIQDEVKTHLNGRGVWFSEEENLRKVAPLVDVMYTIRRRKEYGIVEPTPETSIVNKEVLGLMQSQAIVMNALPRNEEIDPAIDGDPRAAYFRQAENGLYVRMALLKMILE